MDIVFADKFHSAFKGESFVYFKHHETERLQLCDMRCNDDAVERFMSWLEKSTPQSYLGIMTKFTCKADIQDWFADKASELARYAIVEKSEERRCIGFIEVLADIKLHHATINVTIGDRDKRNQGYGSEAVKLVCEYLFNRFGVESIHTYCVTEGQVKCFKKAGFRNESCLRKYRLSGDSLLDCTYLDILREEFLGEVV